jgi:CIC family chloride channel protein
LRTRINRVYQKVLGGTIEKGTSQILYSVAKKASIHSKKANVRSYYHQPLTVGLGGSAGLESPIVVGQLLVLIMPRNTN